MEGRVRLSNSHLWKAKKNNKSESHTRYGLIIDTFVYKVFIIEYKRERIERSQS